MRDGVLDPVLQSIFFNTVNPESGRGIDGVSFRVEREAFVVVTGPIGSGKTTLLHALPDLLPRQQEV